MHTENDKTIFFVAGMERSGTTWLKLLLDSHREVVCRGEAHFFDRLVPRLHKAFDDWYGTLGGHGGANNDASIVRDDADRAIRCAILVTLERWAAAKGVNCVGEKTPANLRCIKRIQHLFPEAKLIHILRDGRDGAVSAWHRWQQDDPAKANIKFGCFSGYVTHYARLWNRAVSEARTVGRELDGLYHELRYEDLIERPEETFGRLCGFLGVDRAPITIATCLETCSFERLSNGRSLGQEDPASFYRKGQIGDWRNHFNEIDRRQFESIAGKVLRDLQYD